MIYKTKGIVLHTIKFGETGIIAKIYTQSHGIISCLVHGVRKSKTQNKAAFFQIMNQVEIVFYSKSKENLSSLKEIKLLFPYQSLHSDMRKSSIAMFLSEVLLKAMKEEESNPPFFDYFSNFLSSLDSSQTSIADFHLHFLYKLTIFLGIQPRNEFSEATEFFDLENGIFTNVQPKHPNYLDEKPTMILYQLANQAETGYKNLEINKIDRKLVLEGFISYFRLHLSGFGVVKSLDVLEEIFE